MKPPLAVVGFLSLFSLAACTDGGVTRREELREPATTAARQALDASPPRDVAITRHTATLLGDGTVLLAGGRDLPTDTEGTPRRNAWLYVSSDVGLTPLPDLVTARAGHTATRLWDGTVLVAGGFDAAGNALKSTELFLPSEADFITGASMLSAHGDGTATLLEDGRVLLVGGYEDARHEHPSAGIELYDPPTQTFSTVQNPRQRAGSNVAVTLADGTVAIYWPDAGDTPAELFDPHATRLNLPEPPLLTPPSGSDRLVAAMRLPSGSLALLGSAGFHTADPSGQCASGSAPCNGQCVSLTTADNCGTCGNACADNATCIDGGCVCNSGTLCDGVCRDVGSDVENCGTCGHACAAGQRCIPTWDPSLQVFGHCEDGCGSLTTCSGECVDTSSDSANCGGCGQGCGEGPWWCLNGECNCYYGRVCDSTCFQSDDHDHCGSCDHACASDETCSGGTCHLAGCPFPSRCGSECVDFATDHQHCGRCDHACSSSEECAGGRCNPCDTASLLCGTACVNLFTDALNCGGCDQVCNGTCAGGVCLPCPAGQAMCGGSCTAVNTHDSCGECYRQCATGYDCVNGDCVLAAGSAPVPALAAGSVWMTKSSSATSYSEGVLEGVAGAASSPNALPSNETFGGNGHTTTALPDGSLLVVGGDDAPQATRVYSSWMGQPLQWLDLGTLQYAYSALTTLLPDGRLLILVGTTQQQPAITNAYLYDGQAIGQPVGSLPLTAPLGAAVQASGKVLLLAHGGPAALLDPDTITATGLELDASLASKAQGTSIALPGGGLFVAGRDGFDVLSAPAGKTVEVHAHSVDIGCDAPSVTRLANGRLLVVGQDRLYEVDPKSGDVVASGDLILPRCHASAIQRRDGTVLLIGGSDDASNTPSVFGELYDPAQGTTKRWSLENGSPPPDAKVGLWFDEPLLMSPSGGMLLDWQSNIIADAQLGFGTPAPGHSHLTLDGSWLGIDTYGTVSFARKSSAVPGDGGVAGDGGVGGEGGVAGTGGTGGMAGPPEPRIYGAEALTLHMADSIDFEAAFPDHPFPGHAPEGSCGTTQSSPTNLPIPVWFPAEGGWPSLGTLTRSGSKTTYRVPSTPFPGLGLLFLATNGDLTPLGPMTIASSPNAARCRDGGECDSGHCVDGVCCDQACDGTCEACSKVKKGGGDDGECGSVAAGTPDSACRDDITTCGENGACDGSGQCALYPDGTECGPDATCRTQSSTGRRSCVENAPLDGNGTAGSAGAPDMGGGATGGTRSEPPPRGLTCDADEGVVSPDGTRYDCKGYRCRSGVCALRCESTRDCKAGYACDSKGNCVAPVAQHAKHVGCGCRVPVPANSSDAELVSLLAAAAAVVRRTTRRPGRRTRRRNV